MKRYLFLVLLSLTVQPVAARAGSVDWATLVPELSDATYVKDDQKCMECHEEYMTDYEKTAHAKAFKHNPKADAIGMDCENCHGPMSKHLDAPKKRPALAVSFGKEAGLASHNKASICLQCHEKGKRMQWQGSVHDRAGLSCDSCHSIRDLRVKEQVCYSCHPKTRAEFQRPSHIPVREGKVSCTGCHNPHGSVGPTLLNEVSVNDTCYTCHADKRGPFLWEHAPVRENCMNCHTPHGSVHANLLKVKPPFLCQQQCHAATGHPSGALSGTGLAGSSPSYALLGKSCLNCHPQIHGSKHPSGARFQR